MWLDQRCSAQPWPYRLPKSYMASRVTECEGVSKSNNGFGSQFKTESRLIHYTFGSRHIIDQAFLFNIQHHKGLKFLYLTEKRLW